MLPYQMVTATFPFVTRCFQVRVLGNSNSKRKRGAKGIPKAVSQKNAKVAGRSLTTAFTIFNRASAIFAA
jgi:hypothetical protein